MHYLDHIYDPTRRELAEMILEKELSKLFTDIPAATLAAVIRDWQARPSDFHLEDATRDFWDIFAAVIESIKLKPSFTAFLTAKNYHWQRETISVTDIQLSSQLEQLKLLPSLDWTDVTTVGDVMQAIAIDDQLEQQQRINDHHSLDSQDSYPIIARRLADGSIKVMDGNRRSLRASLYDQSTIDAWVATTDDPAPVDHWVPVNDLFQIVKLFRFARTDAEKQAVRDSLELILRQSEVARMTYATRVSDAADARTLLEMAPTM